MAIHALAGKPAPAELLIDLNKLENAYYQGKPDLNDPNQLVRFGASGNRLPKHMVSISPWSIPARTPPSAS